MFLLIFLTLVLISDNSLGLPQPKPPPSGEENKPQINEVKINAPRILQKKEHHFYLAYGIFAGEYLNQENFLRASSFLLRWRPHSETDTGWNYQLGFINPSILSVSVGRQWYCCASDPFNPYGRIAGAVYNQASENLAGFADFQRWRVHFGVGIGSLITTEFGWGWSLNGQDLYLQSGFNF